DGNAAAVVGNRHRAVAVQRHLDDVAVTRQRLVDGVVDDLVDHMVQARAVVGVADVHAGALAHRVEPAQNPDRIGTVGGALGLVLCHCGGFRLCHRTYSV